jgi:hypothetical protein
MRSPESRCDKMNTDGTRREEDGTFVLDPELEVRDGGIDRGHDKDIPVTLTKVNGQCVATLDKPKTDDPADVFTKHKVKWEIKNRSGADRTVEIVFIGKNGSPLDPTCVTSKPIKKDKTKDIKCEIPDGTAFERFEYEIRCR